MTRTWADPLSPHAFYVAVDGRDSWSGRLPAPNDEHTDGPFATVRAAQLAMRAGQGGRTTYVRAGSYFLDAPIRIAQADAGDAIMAYPDEHPVLYGGLLVPEWHQGDSGLLVAPPPLHTEVGLPLLISAGKALPNSRFPIAGVGEDHEAAWLFADSSPDGLDARRSFRVRARDAEVFASVRPGSFVTIFGRRGWQDYVLPIKEADAANRIITLDGSTWDTIGEGSRFAILNAAATPGTWRLDPSSTTLQSRFAHAPVPATTLLAALPCIVSIEHARDVTLAGLRLVGSATEGAAVCLSYTQRITLDALGINDTGDGIRLDQATDTRVTRSEIGRTAGFGIVLRHGSDGTVVRGNWLHEIGWLHQDASAIWFDASSRNHFVQNRIENVAKFGIGGGSLTEGGAYDNVIEDNEIYHANQRTSDGGGIMVIGWVQDATRDLIRGNFVSGTAALGNMGWDGKPHTTFQDPVTRLVSEAIYLDDWASDVQVSGNLLCGNIGGIELHAGWNNRVLDNVMIGNAGIAVAIDAENWLGPGAHPHRMEHNRIERNTIVLDQASTGQSGISAVRGDIGAAHFDRNIYVGSGLNAYSFHQVPDTVLSDYSFGFEAWRQRGQDGASSVGISSPQVVLRDGAVRVIGTSNAPPPLPIGEIGRPEDRGGLAERVRRRCGLS